MCFPGYILRQTNWLMTLSQLGLLLDMIGVVLLFVFGLPSAYIENPENGGNLALGSSSEDEIIKVKRMNLLIKIMSFLGLIIVFAGFLLQFIGGFPTKL